MCASSFAILYRNRSRQYRLRRIKELPPLSRACYQYVLDGGKKWAIMGRKEAKALGLKRYIGSPRKEGHAGERLVSNGQCILCELTKRKSERDSKRTIPSRAEAAELREAARKAGLTRYGPARPCRHGHLAKRMVCSAACVTCLTARNAARDKAYPELRRARKRRSDKKHPDRVRANRESWKQANPEKIAASQKKTGLRLERKEKTRTENTRAA